jgi:hypothetical protein
MLTCRHGRGAQRLTLIKSGLQWTVPNILLEFQTLVLSSSMKKDREQPCEYVYRQERWSEYVFRMFLQMPLLSHDTYFPPKTGNNLDFGFSTLSSRSGVMRDFFVSVLPICTPSPSTFENTSADRSLSTQQAAPANI